MKKIVQRLRLWVTQFLKCILKCSKKQNNADSDHNPNPNCSAALESIDNGERFLIRLFSQNALRQNDLGRSPEIEVVQACILSQLAQLGVKAQSSDRGASFDGSKMEVAPCDAVLTNREQLNSKVAKTVVPAFCKKTEGGVYKLLTYEQVALFQYDKNYVPKQDIPDVPAPTNKTVGYLVMESYGQISAIFEVYEGSNIFGSSPTAKQDGHAHKISVSDYLEPDHFEICDGEVRLLSGTWGIEYLGNNGDQVVDSYNGLVIVLNEHLRFIYLEK